MVFLLFAFDRSNKSEVKEIARQQWWQRILFALEIRRIPFVVSLSINSRGSLARVRNEQNEINRNTASAAFNSHDHRYTLLLLVASIRSFVLISGWCLFFFFISKLMAVTPHNAIPFTVDYLRTYRFFFCWSHTNTLNVNISQHFRICSSLRFPLIDILKVCSRFKRQRTSFFDSTRVLVFD